MKKNICFVTTTRAEFGLLKPLVDLIKDSEKYNLTLVVSGTHLSEEFGNTYIEIENNYDILKINIMDKSNKHANAINNIMSNVFNNFYSELDKINKQNKIDMLVLLGDRFEILAITQVAFILGIKICHLAGGDITKGAMDDQFRNAITQLSDYHMPFSEESRTNLIKMNIDNNNIHLIGNPGLEIFKDYKPIIKKDIILRKFNLYEKYILCVFHPETKNNTEYIKSFFNNLSLFLNNNQDTYILILKTNCDPGYLEILSQIESNMNMNNNKNQIIFIDNLERDEYLSVAYYSYLYIGNSSSGLYELPYLKIPIINVGNRQLGRPLSSNVISSEFNDINQHLEYVKTDRDKIISNIKFGYNIYDSKEIFIKSLDTIFFN
jgi:UDP-hydrolysing UDP-N-acetyl-D-glucosamine 2-epimerase|uniref:UDP-N-acetylglucosamine 2-epimerase domain-containing protein n=1 Tax=viral metagenome TaxID=1070528 RepID=A0A6C0IVF9_9ZZZZ